MNDESGFSTPFAMVVIFSLAVAVMAVCFYSISASRKINSYKNDLEARKEVEILIRNIEEKLQELKLTSYDADEYLISSLVESVCSFDFKVSDVSTGIKKDFVSESFLENEVIKEYMNLYGVEALSDYGWINQKLAGKSLIEEIEKEYEKGKTFPLVNAVPPFNLYFMNPDFLKAVIEYSGLKNPEKKADLIIQNLNSITTVKELADILGISENHIFFDLVGFKTLFWQVDLETNKCKCSVVYGAIPKKNSQKEIDRYVLVEKKIISKGGNL